MDNLNNENINTKNSGGQKMKKIWIGVSVVLVILIAVLLFNQAKNNQSEVTIGHISPFTGNVAVYGKWEKQGIELAIDEINHAGGINGKKLE